MMQFGVYILTTSLGKISYLTCSWNLIYRFPGIWKLQYMSTTSLITTTRTIDGKKIPFIMSNYGTLILHFPLFCYIY